MNTTRTYNKYIVHCTTQLYTLQLSIFAHYIYYINQLNFLSIRCVYGFLAHLFGFVIFESEKYDFNGIEFVRFAISFNRK